MEKDDLGRYVFELSDSAAVLVEQIQDEITVVIASVVNVHFEATADQALQLSRALAAAAANAIAADKCDVHNKRPPEGGLSAALIGAGLIRLHGLTHFALASVNRT
jgi:hypothetical protein